MVFPFGVSVSDFISGIKLVKTAIEAFSSTHGARSDFVALSRSLDSLNRAPTVLAKLNLSTDKQRQALYENLNDCKECVSRFLVGVAKFQVLKNEYATKARVISNLRKVQWALCKKEDVRKFRDEIDSLIGSLNVLLATFQVESQLIVARSTEATESHVESVSRSMNASAQVYTDLDAKICRGQDAQNQNLERIDHGVTDCTAEVRSQRNVLLDVQHRIKAGLSTEEQMTTHRMLKEALTTSPQFQGLTESMERHERKLEHLVVEVKAFVYRQRETPAQILFEPPVILRIPLDPTFRVFRIPFELISSTHMFLSMLWSHIDGAMQPCAHATMFILQDTATHNVIDTSMPWDALLQPGQVVDTTVFMTFAKRENLIKPAPLDDESFVVELPNGEKVICTSITFKYENGGDWTWPIYPGTLNYFHRLDAG